MAAQAPGRLGPVGQRSVVGGAEVPRPAEADAGGATPRFVWGGSSYSSLAAWRTGTGQEKVGTTNVGLSGDPQLTSGGAGAGRARLASSSPMVDAALDLASFGIDAGPRDHFGGAAPKGARRDVGAHELR